MLIQPPLRHDDPASSSNRERLNNPSPADVSLPTAVREVLRCFNPRLVGFGIVDQSAIQLPEIEEPADTGNNAKRG